jgi:tRNA(fMet)-specific endonuclease VapC
LDTYSAVYVPLVVVAELLYGVQRSARPGDNRAAMENWLATTIIVTQTRETANQYATIKDALRRAGTPIPENDIWIAAHAREFDLELAFLDAHFEVVAGLNSRMW